MWGFSGIVFVFLFFLLFPVYVIADSYILYLLFFEMGKILYNFLIYLWKGRMQKMLVDSENHNLSIAINQGHKSSNRACVHGQ